jgi:hypothetical protein
MDFITMSDMKLKIFTEILQDHTNYLLNKKYNW